MGKAVVYPQKGAISMTSATTTLPDGTTVTLRTDNAGLHLVLGKHGQDLTIEGDGSVYALLSIVLGMPWEAADEGLSTARVARGLRP